MDPSPDACRITTVDEGSQYPVIDALREALRLERDARDAAVRAGIAVAREADFDALRETAETVASRFSARVALDVEARIAADAEDAKKRHADLERRLAEVTSENGRNKARNASLAELAERLERRLDATSARCVALEGETARLASRVSSLLVSSRLVETSVQTTRVEEDTHATAQNSKRGETLSNERFPRRANVARRPPAFLHEDAENVFVRREEKASALDGAGLVKRARSEAADDDHGTYLEAQPLGGFGSSASVFGAESETAKPRNGADGDADDVVAVSRTTESFSSESKTTPSAKPRNRRRAKRPNAAERRVAKPHHDPTEDACDSVEFVAEEIRAQDVKTRRRRFRERARARMTKVSFANALDAKKNVSLPSAWARAEGFFDAETARAVFLRPST